MDDAHSTLNFLEEGNQIRTKKSCAKYRVGFKNPMKEARHGISTCKKLLKVLNILKDRLAFFYQHFNVRHYFEVVW
ncbi:uncharacterized protein DS421_5g149180 [Arachis hypogaea]|nr:uncharacterized protein DS421_5g149180 [Arachis hypogaea]